MKKKNFFEGYSFMQLSRLLAERKRALSVSKLNGDSPKDVALNQKLYDQVKQAIIDWKVVNK